MLTEDGSDLATLVDSLRLSSKKALVRRLTTIFPSVEAVGVSANADGTKHVVVSERMTSRGGKKTFPIPAWLLSEGMRRVVAIFTLLEARPPPPLIAIEEIENGLDPWTLESVLDAPREAADQGTQIIVTTHSPFFLDHIDLADVVHVRRASGESTYEATAELESRSTATCWLLGQCTSPSCSAASPGVAMRRRRDRAPRVALFVEGRHTPTERRRSELEELWRALCTLCEVPDAQSVAVHGFTKFQLVATGDADVARAALLESGDSQKIPLDLVVATTFDRAPFDVLVVAFDAHPSNQHLRPAVSGAVAASDEPPCQHKEVAFVLRHFANSKVLPDSFKLDAGRILKRYETEPRPAPRQRGRPPRNSLDLLYMDPEFEALVPS